MLQLADPIDQGVGANSNFYLRNAWYVAAISNAVVQDLQPVRMLGTDLVLYRTKEGKPVALEDACPHRKLPLSMGRLVGDGNGDEPRRLAFEQGSDPGSGSGVGGWCPSRDGCGTDHQQPAQGAIAHL